MKTIPPHSLVAQGDDQREQYGALCWRREKGQVEVLLVTSRETGRWVIPKGWPVKGLSPQASALQEAWEEAGVRGRASPDSIGLYSYDKVIDRNGNPTDIPCVVGVFAVEVKARARQFPEADQRRAKWFVPERAARKVDEPELQALIAAFTPPAP